MDILKKLMNAMDYIEKNLYEEIDFATVSRIACVTQDSFTRFFSYMTGMMPKEYIRRRRLTLAAYELQTGEDKVIDIAVKCGYESADAFSRAFARQHGGTPSALRKSGGTLRVYPPVSFHIAIKGGEKMNCRVMNVPEIEVFGVSREWNCSAKDRFTSVHTMWSDELDFVPGEICDGFDGVWYGIWDAGKYSIARGEADVSGKNLEKRTIPAGLYAIFTTEKGGYAGDELPKLRDLIFNSWLPDSPYKQKQDFEVEVYHLCTDREERRKKRYYELWIPVE
ncbi:MAG: AraC family transcriptional regulator [Ruminococcaceae bacterium]|nr:AraC family transcriptional regulator [Oscillospiraceae bacterium]